MTHFHVWKGSEERTVAIPVTNPSWLAGIFVHVPPVRRSLARAPALISAGMLSLNPAWLSSLRSPKRWLNRGGFSWPHWAVVGPRSPMFWFRLVVWWWRRTSVTGLLIPGRFGSLSHFSNRTSRSFQSSATVSCLTRWGSFCKAYRKTAEKGGGHPLIGPLFCVFILYF